jgi:uncharacterized protein YuzE
MKLSYDPRYNLAYLSLKEKVEQVETIKLGEALLIDLAPDGTVYGIEFLNANEQLTQGIGRMRLFNQATGKSAELDLLNTTP